MALRESQPRTYQKVAKAKREGVLTPQPCEVCGIVDTVAHHDDYRKPLDVRWLCGKHHMRHHADSAKRGPRVGRPRKAEADKLVQIRFYLERSLVDQLIAEAAPESLSSLLRRIVSEAKRRGEVA